jgi:anti-sigma regulatory factor (Ser/Thr protein kinase)
LSEVERVNGQLDEFAKVHEIRDDIIQKLKISIDELVTNIISYGFEDDDDHSIEIGFDYSGKQLVVELIDGGVPFNPLDAGRPDTTLSIEDREIGGLGTLLVNELVDEVAYRRRNNTNVVRLTMNINN